MRFFEQQARARRHTVRLVLLYVCVLALTVGLLTWVCSSFFPPNVDPLKYYMVTALLFAGVILACSLYRLHALAQGGGHMVAQALGGERLQESRATLAERRALNVVEEMALAAGVRRPAVYVLPGGSINAFAAGMSQRDAVIGITQGAIRQLKRDELQAVVAHEFSHILNGDMRLNMRLTGWLFGLQMIVVLGKYLFMARPGHRLWRSGSRENLSGLALAVVGFVCLVCGSLSALLAGWIQAAICRQREYLADASAVQFTRQSEGLASALYKIAVSHQRPLHGLHAGEYAHFMFSSIELPHVFENLSATHPAIIDRIRRVNPMRARQWEQEIEVAQAWSDKRPIQGVFAFARERQEQAWAVAEIDAQWHERQALLDAMREKIRLRHPGYAMRQDKLRRTAPGIWLALAANGDRAALLVQTMLAPADFRVESALLDGVGEALHGRLLRHRLPDACYLDLLEYMLPFAVAEQSHDELLAAAATAYRSRPQARLVQHCAWHMLHLYLEETPVGETDSFPVSPDVATHVLRALLRLLRQARCNSGQVDAAAFQDFRQMLKQAVSLSQERREQLRVHCERVLGRWSDYAAADALRRTLELSLQMQ